MIKIAVFGIVVCIFCVKMNGIRPEYSFLIALIAGVILAGLTLEQMNSMFRIFQTIQSKSGISNEFFKILLKLIGISFLGDFVSNICKDANQHTVGKQVEMISKLSILLVSLPILQSLLTMIEKLLEA